MITFGKNFAVRLLIPVLAALAALALAPWTGRGADTPATVPAAPSPVDYARQIVASHGGPEKLLRKVKFTEKFHLDGDLVSTSDRTSIVIPPKLWLVGYVERVPGEYNEAVATSVWMWTLVPLVHPATKLEFAPDTLVAGRKARGLKITGSIESPIEAYFDAATHDIVKMVWNSQQFFFWNPVEVSGTRVPSRTVLIRRSGKEGFRAELRDIQRLEELPPELGHFEGDTLFFTGEDRASATAQLLRVPSAPPRLVGANGVMEFEHGRDFTWEPGTRAVTLTAGSRIPFKTSAELHPAPDAPHAYKSQRGTNRWMFFGPGRVIHDLQCVAGYPSDDAWRPPFPSAAPDVQLGALRAKLRAKQPAKLVMLGDSISTGGDASAVAQVWPHQPGYPGLVARALETRFGGKVTLSNLSKGGMDSKWGATRVADVIAEKPDLLLVAFGMNDASGHRPPGQLAEVTRQIITPVRAALPDCAVIVVSPMTANSEWIHAAPELYPAYAQALGGLTGRGIAFADVTAVWSAVEARKKHFDLTGNGLNHPNDLGHRLYAETILAVIGGGR